MTEATTQPRIQDALDRAHRERAQAFRSLFGALFPKYAARPRAARVVTA